MVSWLFDEKRVLSAVLMFFCLLRTERQLVGLLRVGIVDPVGSTFGRQVTTSASNRCRPSEVDPVGTGARQAIEEGTAERQGTGRKRGIPMGGDPVGIRGIEFS
jgi:hypothetical protein